MQDRTPAPTFRLCERHPGVVKPTSIVVVEPAVRPRGPDDLRHRISHLPKVFFGHVQTGVLQRLFPHIALTENAGDNQEEHFEEHPTRMFECAPITGAKNAVYGLGPEHPAKKMIRSYYQRGRDQDFPVTIEGEKRE